MKEWVKWEKKKKKKKGKRKEGGRNNHPSSLDGHTTGGSIEVDLTN
jgi:hypothetical protein